MIEIGRLCTKIAGRDAGKLCVIIEVVDKNYCIIDGDVRRKRCNVTHLDPLGKTINIEKGASHEKITSEFKKLGIELKAKIKKEKKPQKHKQKVVKAKKEDKKEKVKKDKKDTKK